MKAIRERTLIVVLSLLLGVSGTALAQLPISNDNLPIAGPHTPAGDGGGWIADACNAASPPRDYQECCETKCAEWWTTNIPYVACRNACYDNWVP